MEFQDLSTTEGKIKYYLNRYGRWVLPVVMVAAVTIVALAMTAPTTEQPIYPFTNSILFAGSPTKAGKESGAALKAAKTSQPTLAAGVYHYAGNGTSLYNGLDSPLVDLTTLTDLGLFNVIVDGPELSSTLAQAQNLQKVDIKAIIIYGEFSRVYLPKITEFRIIIEGGTPDEYQDPGAIKNLLFFDLVQGRTWDLYTELLSLGVTTTVAVGGHTLIAVNPKAGTALLNVPFCNEILKNAPATFKKIIVSSCTVDETLVLPPGLKVITILKSEVKTPAKLEAKLETGPMVQAGQQSTLQGVQQPMLQAGQQPMLQAGQQSILQGVQKPMLQAGQQSTLQGVQQPMLQGVQQPMLQGVQQPMLQGVQQPMLQGVQQPMLQGVQQPMLQGVQQPMLQGVQQSTVQAGQKSTLQGVQQSTLQGVQQSTLQAGKQSMLQAGKQPMLQAGQKSTLQGVKQTALPGVHQPMAVLTEIVTQAPILTAPGAAGKPTKAPKPPKKTGTYFFAGNSTTVFDGLDAPWVNKTGMTELSLFNVILDGPTFSNSLADAPNLEKLNINADYVIGDFNRVYLPKLTDYKISLKTATPAELQDPTTLKNLLFFDKAPGQSWELSQLLTIGVNVTVSAGKVKVIETNDATGTAVLNVPFCNEILENAGPAYTNIIVSGCALEDVVPNPGVRYIIVPEDAPAPLQMGTLKAKAASQKSGQLGDILMATATDEEVAMAKALGRYYYYGDGVNYFTALDSPYLNKSAIVDLEIHHTVIDAPSLTASLDGATNIETIVLEPAHFTGKFGRVQLPKLKSFKLTLTGTDPMVHKDPDFLQNLLFFDKTSKPWDIKTDLLSLGVNISVTVDDEKIIVVDPEEGNLVLNVPFCSSLLQDPKTIAMYTKAIIGSCNLENVTLPTGVKYLNLDLSTPSSRANLNSLLAKTKALEEFYGYVPPKSSPPEAVLNLNALPMLKKLSLTGVGVMGNATSGVTDLTLDASNVTGVIDNMEAVFKNVKAASLFNVRATPGGLQNKLLKKVMNDIQPPVLLVSGLKRGASSAPESMEVEQTLKTLKVAPTATNLMINTANGTTNSWVVPEAYLDWKRYDYSAFKDWETYKRYLTYDSSAMSFNGLSFQVLLSAMMVIYWVQ